MLNIVLFGPPGAGKGTQAEKLVEKYHLIHISTGDIFRYNIKNETELGKLAKSYIDKGELVPDEVTIKMLQSEVEKHPGVKGFIFDGFPRTIDQAKALDQYLATKGTGITLMLALEVPREELIKRLLKRGEVSRRSDDQNKEIIDNRIAEYLQKTAPLKEYYSKQGKAKLINGVGTIDEIFHRLTEAIDAAQVK